MKIATFNENNVTPSGRCNKRNAARGIVKKDDKILLLYIELYNVYKFPGGGVESGETHIDALKREFLEETGYKISNIKKLEYKTIEINNSRDESYDYWMHESDYYIVEVEDIPGDPEPDTKELEERGCEIDYEKPVWISINNAIENNKKLLLDPKFESFVKRELFVLEKLEKYN